MVVNPRAFIENAEIGPFPELAAGLQLAAAEQLNLDKLPDGVVSGTALLDLSAVPSTAVRAGVSLSMLFASRAATAAMEDGDTEDDWLASYTSSLGQLGFAIAGAAQVHNKFKKTGLAVNKAIIPFLTVAFGGAAIGPIILAGLKNLQEMDQDEPWIKLFDSESRRFDARELHFAAVSSTDTDTNIRYVVVRLNVSLDAVSVLFFKVTKAKAEFESVTTTMSANNSLMVVIEPALRERLGSMTNSFILEAKLTK
jgi:hypothetical protein